MQAARGASLLIHEATFEDDKAEDAERKRHSTTGDALGVAKKVGGRMGARWQRGRDGGMGVMR